VSLEPKAFDVLSALVSRRGSVVDKDELMRQVWPDCFVQESSITQNIHVVRRALGDGEIGSHKYIVTVPGRGYKFIADVSEVGNASTVPGAGCEGSASGDDVTGAIGATNADQAADQYSVIPTTRIGQDYVAPAGGDKADYGDCARPLSGVGGGVGMSGRARTNLPVQPTGLIGRESDVAAVKEMIRQDSIRLITLTGPGGSGKTSLAIRAGKELLEDFADGVWLVELAHLSDPSLIIPTIAQALGVREERSRPVADCLRSYLEGKRLLLILDNFEHLMAGELAIVNMLAHSSELKVLVTSRIVLKVRVEHEYHVESLALPRASRGMIDLEELAECASVALFMERARAAAPEFELTAENAEAVSRICIRLDGLPLAIELAAPWIKVLSAEALLERLSKSLSLLGRATGPAGAAAYVTGHDRMEQWLADRRREDTI